MQWGSHGLGIPIVLLQSERYLKRENLIKKTKTNFQKIVLLTGESSKTTYHDEAAVKYACVVPSKQHNRDFFELWVIFLFQNFIFSRIIQIIYNKYYLQSTECASSPQDAWTIAPHTLLEPTLRQHDCRYIFRIVLLFLLYKIPF